MTYLLRIDQINAYEPADVRWQLQLEATEENREIFLYEGTSVDDCKTKAAAIFKNGGSALTWIGDVSQDNKGKHDPLGTPGTQGTDLLWAVAPLTL